MGSKTTKELLKLKERLERRGMADGVRYANINLELEKRKCSS